MNEPLIISQRSLGRNNLKDSYLQLLYYVAATMRKMNFDKRKIIGKDNIIMTNKDKRDLLFHNYHGSHHIDFINWKENRLAWYS